MQKEINLFEESKQAFLPGFEGQPLQKKIEREQKLSIKKIIEALLFASGDPLSFQKIREIVETKYSVRPKLIRDAIEDLQEDCAFQQRAYRLEETAQGFIFKTCEEYAPFIEQIFRNKRIEKLSQASLEVLAIIAYKQPITKAQIEDIRGVDCSGTVQTLIERELIQQLGKSETLGRPTLYGITPQFLTHFGLKDLKELPDIKL